MKIRLLMLIPNLSGGGAERVFLNICRNLDRSVFDVRIAVLSRLGREHSADIPNDLPLEELGIARSRHALPALIRLIRRTRPHLVFSNGAELNLVVSIVAALRRGQEVYVAREPNVAAVHNAQMPDRHMRGLLMKLFYRAYHCIVCQTGAMQSDLVARYGLRRERTTVIHNPVDIGWIREQSACGPAARTFAAPHSRAAGGPDRDTGSVRPGDGPVFVAAGRLDYQKDFGLLVQALAQCRNPAIRVQVLGEGSLLAEHRELASALGVAERIEWLGYIANPYPYFRRAHALVISSRYEGLPNVALEALACGTPVLSFARVNGLDDLVPICKGITLLDERSAGSLANGMDRMAEARDKSAVDVSALDSKVVVASYGRLFSSLAGAAA